MTCSSGSDQALRGGIAQLGERNAGSVEVRSSILLASTTLQLYLQLPQLTSTALKPTLYLALSRISLTFAFLSLTSTYPFKTGWWTRIWTRNLCPSFSLFSGLES